MCVHSGCYSSDYVTYAWYIILLLGSSTYSLWCSQVFKKIEVQGFDETLFQTRQVFYASKDGTRIPMFILHRKVT